MDQLYSGFDDMYEQFGEEYDAFQKIKGEAVSPEGKSYYTMYKALGHRSVDTVINTYGNKVGIGNHEVEKN